MIYTNIQLIYRETGIFQCGRRNKRKPIRKRTGFLRLSRNPRLVDVGFLLFSFAVAKKEGLPPLFQAIQVDRHLLHVLHGGRHQRLFRNV